MPNLRPEDCVVDPVSNMVDFYDEHGTFFETRDVQMADMQSGTIRWGELRKCDCDRCDRFRELYPNDLTGHEFKVIVRYRIELWANIGARTVRHELRAFFVGYEA